MFIDSVYIEIVLAFPGKKKQNQYAAITEHLMIVCVIKTFINYFEEDIPPNPTAVITEFLTMLR